jgi:hypothetical protein
MKVKPNCSNCGGIYIFVNTEGIPGNVYANYLLGLGGTLYFAKLYPTICQDCGLVRFFTNDDAISKLNAAKQWKRLANDSEQDAPSNGG